MHPDDTLTDLDIDFIMREAARREAERVYAEEQYAAWSEAMGLDDEQAAQRHEDAMLDAVAEHERTWPALI